MMSRLGLNRNSMGDRLPRFEFRRTPIEEGPCSFAWVTRSEEQAERCQFDLRSRIHRTPHEVPPRAQSDDRRLIRHPRRFAVVEYPLRQPEAYRLVRIDGPRIEQTPRQCCPPRPTECPNQADGWFSRSRAQLGTSMEVDQIGAERNIESGATDRRTHLGHGDRTRSCPGLQPNPIDGGALPRLAEERVQDSQFTGEAAPEFQLNRRPLLWIPFHFSHPPSVLPTRRTGRRSATSVPDRAQSPPQRLQ